jgi:uncharacterized protein (DUF1800 family)
MRSVVLASVCTIALVACGGGGGSSGTASVSPPPDGGGIVNPPPPAPPPGTPPASSLPDAPVSKEVAARFLHNATFGPNEALIDTVARTGPRKWLMQQFETPISYYTGFTGDDEIDKWQNKDVSFCDGATLPPGYNTDNCWGEYYGAQALKRQFFNQAVSGTDQVRQRMAFALSQILVISAQDIQGAYGFRDYHNILRGNAFGNYRNVLESVTTHPMMGDYLGMVNNDKTDPNENYARELLQLFSVGTCKLNLNGTLETGNCVATYDNAMVREYAYALTGWTYPPGGYNPYCTNGNCGGWQNNTYMRGSMVSVQAQHDQTARTLLNGKALKASRTPREALTTVLDSVMEHQNIAPFIAKALIQFFVTSNPSPAYVQRVATAFNTGRYTDSGGSFGTNVKGDLTVTIAAVLLDSEAFAAPADGFGKLREPVLYMAGAIRAMNGTTDGHPLGEYWWGSTLGQPVFNSPTVFNFFSPVFPLPGTTDGTVAPEFTTENANTSLARINFANDLVYYWYNNGNGLGAQSDVPGAFGTKLNYTTAWDDLAGSNPAALVNQFDLLFTSGITPQAQKDAIVTAMNAWPTSNTNHKRERVKTLAYLMMASPFYQVQR